MSLLPKSENNKERFAALLELLTSNSIRDNADNAFLATFQDVLLMNSDIITANVDSDSGDEEEITIFWEIIRIMISFPELDLLKASTLPWFSVDNINKCKFICENFIV